jgi:hypothetical protein
MKKIDLGQTLGTVANFGVVVGIILLVFELSQNRDMMQAQIRNEIATSLSGVLTPSVTDGELVERLTRTEDGEELTDSEEYRVFLQSELIFRYWENVHYQYRKELYDESEWAGHRGAIESSVTSRLRFQQYWCLTRSNYSAEFRDFIDELLPEDICQGTAQSLPG